MNNICKLAKDALRTLDAYIQSLDDDTKCLLQLTFITDDGYQPEKAIRDKSAIGVSDCSVRVAEKSLAIAWIITDAQRTFVYEGQLGCPTFHDAIDSYSAEMFGIYVLLTGLCVITEFHDFRSGKIIVACDNDSSLSMSLDSYKRAKPPRYHMSNPGTALEAQN